MRQPALRPRNAYLLLVGVVIVVGLATRRYRSVLTATVGGYVGDALWAVMVFLLLALIRPSAKTTILAEIAALISFGVEVSQIYHAPWIDSLRHTTLGGLALGYDFDWRDLICYAAGIAVAAELDVCLLRLLARSSRAALSSDA